MKKLYFDKDRQSIVLTDNGKEIRFTKVSYLSSGWEDKEDEELANWGLKQNIDRFAILPFQLFFEDSNKIKVFHTHNGEYKVESNGYIAGFTSRLNAQAYIAKKIGREYSLPENKNVGGIRFTQLIDELSF